MSEIHKSKNGRLHIYVRQDKYKDKLKSHNWVGRTYINGQQKIISSGTTDLEKAKVILEKWYDDLHTQSTEKTQTKEENQQKDLIPPSKPAPEIEKNRESNENKQSNLSNIRSTEPKKEGKGLLDKLKNIKFTKSTISKKDTSSQSHTSKKVSKLKDNLSSFFKSRVSKMSVAGEEIVGLDISHQAIRVAQVSKGKDEKWILDKISYRLLDQEKISENLIENKDYLSEEIKLAIANAKITAPNAALSIPVTSAIIRVVTSPLMTEEELKKAIETDSLWENLVQLTENMNDYSVFHQVINRNTKNNTMDILFVASKLSDINAFSSIVKKASLNPVIMDVRCFTLKNALDNLSLGVSPKVSTAIMEFGTEENYLMIIHNNIPIITDIFLRPQEKQSILNADPNKENDDSKDVIRRYSMQIKQAIAEYEGKYDTKINSISVVSGLKNIRDLIPLFTKNLPTTGFKLFDPTNTIAIPSYNQAKTNIENKSVFTSVLGLAFRKLDVFGYYKFVTAVKNINLLPNREAVKQQNKLKFLSGFAAKGLAGSVVGIYLLLIVLSFVQLNWNKKKLLAFDQIQTEFNTVNSKYSKLMKQKKEMEAALKLGSKVNSNQVMSYRALAQITRSVPSRVQFAKMEFNGKSNFVIEGSAFSDQDILNFIGNLNKQSLIAQASLAKMNVSNAEGQQSASNKKGFSILCLLKAGT